MATEHDAFVAELTEAKRRLGEAQGRVKAKDAAIASLKHESTVTQSELQLLKHNHGAQSNALQRRGERDKENQHLLEKLLADVSGMRTDFREIRDSGLMSLSTIVNDLKSDVSEIKQMIYEWDKEWPANEQTPENANYGAGGNGDVAHSDEAQPKQGRDDLGNAERSPDQGHHHGEGVKSLTPSENRSGRQQPTFNFEVPSDLQRHTHKPSSSSSAREHVKREPVGPERESYLRFALDDPKPGITYLFTGPQFDKDKGVESQSKPQQSNSPEPAQLDGHDDDHDGRESEGDYVYSEYDDSVDDEPRDYRHEIRNPTEPRLQSWELYCMQFPEDVKPPPEQEWAEQQRRLEGYKSGLLHGFHPSLVFKGLPSPGKRAAILRDIIADTPTFVWERSFEGPHSLHITHLSPWAARESKKRLTQKLKHTGVEIVYDRSIPDKSDFYAGRVNTHRPVAPQTPALPSPGAQSYIIPARKPTDVDSRSHAPATGTPGSVSNAAAHEPVDILTGSPPRERSIAGSLQGQYALPQAPETSNATSDGFAKTADTDVTIASTGPCTNNTTVPASKPEQIDAPQSKTSTLSEPRPRNTRVDDSANENVTHTKHDAAASSLRPSAATFVAPATTRASTPTPSSNVPAIGAELQPGTAYTPSDPPPSSGLTRSKRRAASRKSLAEKRRVEAEQQSTSEANDEVELLAPAAAGQASISNDADPPTSAAIDTASQPAAEGAKQPATPAISTAAKPDFAADIKTLITSMQTTQQAPQRATQPTPRPVAPTVKLPPQPRIFVSGPDYVVPKMTPMVTTPTKSSRAPNTVDSSGPKRKTYSDAAAIPSKSSTISFSAPVATPPSGPKFDPRTGTYPKPGVALPIDSSLAAPDDFPPLGSSTSKVPQRDDTAEKQAIEAERAKREREEHEHEQRQLQKQAREQQVRDQRAKQAMEQATREQQEREEAEAREQRANEQRQLEEQRIAAEQKARDEQQEREKRQAREKAELEQKATQDRQQRDQREAKEYEERKARELQQRNQLQERRQREKAEKKEARVQEERKLQEERDLQARQQAEAEAKAALAKQQREQEEREAQLLKEQAQRDLQARQQAELKQKAAREKEQREQKAAKEQEEHEQKAAAELAARLLDEKKSLRQSQESRQAELEQKAAREKEECEQKAAKEQELKAAKEEKASLEDERIQRQVQENRRLELEVQAGRVKQRERELKEAKELKARQEDEARLRPEREQKAREEQLERNTKMHDQLAQAAAQHEQIQAQARAHAANAAQAQRAAQDLADQASSTDEQPYNTAPASPAQAPNTNATGTPSRLGRAAAAWNALTGSAKRKGASEEHSGSGEDGRSGKRHKPN